LYTIPSSLGKSFFSELAGSLGLKKNQELEIRSGQSGLILTEIVPWLASFEKMGEMLSQADLIIPF